MKLPRTLDDLQGLVPRGGCASRRAGNTTRLAHRPKRAARSRTSALRPQGVRAVSVRGSLWSNGGQHRPVPRHAFSRWDRVRRAGGRLRQPVRARPSDGRERRRHDLHAAGASILFCDERVLTSDEDAWELFAREAVEAEAYSRRLGKAHSRGIRGQIPPSGRSGGQSWLGFRRVAGRLKPDPLTIGSVVRAFERFASVRADDGK